MTRKRKIVAAAVAAAVVAAGIAIPLAVIPSPKPKVTVKAPNVFTPPKTINTTCTADDTQALGTWLLSVPNGTPGHDNIAKLKKGACYEVAGTVWWRGPENIVLNGNGATIKQPLIAPTTHWYIAGQRDNPAVKPYCGSSAYQDDLYSADTGQPLLLSVAGGCDITIENLTIDGQHTGAGDPAPDSFYQPASFISLYGAQRVLIDHVTETGPYGDCLTNDGFNQAPGGGGGYPSTDVTYEYSSCSAAGRADVSETNGAHRVLVTDSTFSGGGLDIFDIEQDVTYPSYAEEDIDITHNTIVGQNYGFLVAALTGSEIQRIAFTDNTLTDGAQMRIFIAPHNFGGMINNSITVEGNISKAASSWPNRSPVNVANLYGPSVLVANNVDPAPQYGGKGYPFATVPKGALACGDSDPLAGTALDGACESPLPVVSQPMVPALPS